MFWRKCWVINFRKKGMSGGKMSRGSWLHSRACEVLRLQQTFCWRVQPQASNSKEFCLLGKQHREMIHRSPACRMLKELTRLTLVVEHCHLMASPIQQILEFKKSWRTIFVGVIVVVDGVFFGCYPDPPTTISPKDQKETSPPPKGLEETKWCQSVWVNS